VQPLKVIATIHTDFPSKFGIPRQGGLVDALKATVTFEPEYRDASALRGLEGYSHVQVVWWFDRAEDTNSLIERKPYAKGPEELGVFATRSPMRPNPIAVSSVDIAYVAK
jgi:tRNA-Thr(GGU) m(6)t(6)A37 methyltransferase TsaA